MKLPGKIQPPIVYAGGYWFSFFIAMAIAKMAVDFIDIFVLFLFWSLGMIAGAFLVGGDE